MIVLVEVPQLKLKAYVMLEDSSFELQGLRLQFLNLRDLCSRSTNPTNILDYTADPGTW